MREEAVSGAAVTRIVHTEDGAFMELTVGRLSTVMVPLERLSSADLGTFVAPPAFLPMDGSSDSAEKPPTRNEWVGLLASTRASRAGRGR